MFFKHAMVQTMMAATSVSRATNQSEMKFQRVLRCVVMHEEGVVVPHAWIQKTKHINSHQLPQPLDWSQCSQRQHTWRQLYTYK